MTQSTLNPKMGIIGGSGLYAMSQFKIRETVDIITPYGKPSDSIVVGELGGKEVAFLPRHGVGHCISPSEIPFKANIYAFKKLGIDTVLSVSAVGSLKEEIKPGHMVIVDQFIDRTQLRPSTFFEQGLVAHVSMADPVCDYLRGLLAMTCKQLGITSHKHGTYICMEGPQFSTRAESNWYRSMGAHVIGMTNLQEAKLSREAGMCYATLALSTDYDCWHVSEKDVTTAQILEVLQQNVSNAQKILEKVVALWEFKEDCKCHHSLVNAIMTDKDKIPPVVKERLDLIIGKYL